MDTHLSIMCLPENNSSSVTESFVHKSEDINHEMYQD